MSKPVRLLKNTTTFRAMGVKKINPTPDVVVDDQLRKKSRTFFLFNAYKFVTNKFFKTASTNFPNYDEDDAAKQSTSSDSPFADVPTEIVLQMFRHLDKPGLANARAVCSSWNSITKRYLQSTNPIMPVSRLSITYVPECSSYKFSWCNYTMGEKTQFKCHELLVTKEEIKSGMSLSFCFAQLNIQRLMIESMPNGVLNDMFVKFLREQLSYCQEFRPVQLSIKNVDLGKLSSDSLKNLLEACSNRLEVLEFFAIDNVAPDLITDDHLLLFEHNRVRRLSIQFKDSAEDAHIENLQVGDTSLQAFAKLRMFPSFVMGRCTVTAQAVCEYVKEWLEVAATEDCMKSHSLTLSDCPNVSKQMLEEQCAQLGLTVIKRTTDNTNKFPFDSAENGTHSSYAIQLDIPQQEFVVNLLTSN
ncbi:hypothetical protein M3Y96_00847400 [Aphelenchoides besseyi]|nr:hypothetical protein M3Y96_00847400 [Aphelenchoides besseyi]